MSNYLRDKTPGGTYFFTLVTYRRNPIFINEKSVALFRRSLSETKKIDAFRVDAIVFIPDHIHLIIELPENESNYSKIISRIKKRFGQEYIGINPEFTALSESSIKRKERGIWQRRFWEHKIRDDDDYLAHVNYIHLNPLKHGLVSNISDWKWSSYFSFLNRGFYDKDWGREVSQEIAGAEWD